MRKKITSLLLLPASIGLLAIGTMSCATPAVKKPDTNKPSQTHGTQTSQTSNTSTTTKGTTKLSDKPVQKSLANDTIVLIDSVSTGPITP